MAVSYWGDDSSSAFAPYRARLTNPVRRGPEAEAEAAEPEAAAGPERPSVVAAAEAAGHTLRRAPREPRRQLSPHNATACGGSLFRQRQTSVPPRLRRSSTIKSNSDGEQKVNTADVSSGSAKVEERR